MKSKRRLLLAALYVLACYASLTALGGAERNRRGDTVVLVDGLLRRASTGKIDEVTYYPVEQQFVWYADGVRYVTPVPSGSYDEVESQLRALSVTVSVGDHPSPRADLGYTTFAISSLVLLLALPLGLVVSALTNVANSWPRRITWAAAVLLLPIVGSAAYILSDQRIGRPEILVPILVVVLSAVAVSVLGPGGRGAIEFKSPAR